MTEREGIRRLQRNIIAEIPGERIGECELLIGGCPVGKTALLAGRSVAARDYGFYLRFLLRLFSRG